MAPAFPFGKGSTQTAAGDSDAATVSHEHGVDDDAISHPKRYFHRISTGTGYSTKSIWIVHSTHVFWFQPVFYDFLRVDFSGFFYN